MCMHRCVCAANPSSVPGRYLAQTSASQLCPGVTSRVVISLSQSLWFHQVGTCTTKVQVSDWKESFLASLASIAIGDYEPPFLLPEGFL